MNRLFRLVGLSVTLMALVLSVAVVGAQDEDTLVIAFEQEAPNLAPLNTLVFGNLPEGFYARDLWEWDENREIFPQIAAEIPTFENGMVEVTEDGDTQVTVTLRDDITWSDGTPITTADCEVWHRIRTDTSTSTNVARAGYPDLVSDFQIVDDHTFTITYTGTFPDYATVNEKPECRYPAHVFGPMIDGGTLEDSDYFTGGAEFEVAGADFTSRTVGYGPYVLTEWNIGESMVYRANPNWMGEAPAFERIVVRFITDDTQMRNAQEVGEVDVTFNWSDDLQSAYAAIEGVETFAAPGVFSDALWIRSGPIGNSPDHGGDALQDPLVRQAIPQALNRLLFAEQLVGPGIAVPTSWYPSVLWPDDLPFLSYDVARARSLLDEAGWIDADGDEPAAADVEGGLADCSAVTPRANDAGTELSDLRFVTTENTLRNNYQLVIQEALNCVGIGTDIQIIPATNLFAAFADRGTLTNYEWDLAIFANSANALFPAGDPDSYSCDGIPSDENPDGFNPWQFCDPEYDAIDQQIQNTLPGPERDELIAEAVTRHFEGFFWHGLRLRSTWFGVSSDVVDPASVEANVGTLASNWMNQVEFWTPAN